MVNQAETSPLQAKGLINTVSDKLILKAAEIYLLLVIGLEAATLCLETITVKFNKNKV